MKRLVLSAVFVMMSCIAMAQDRVGQLTTVAGEVSITRHATGQVALARQVGPRVRNGSLYGNDTLSTGGDGSATLVFTDASRLVLEPSTTITVRETDLSAVLGTGDVKKPLGRTIKILAGNVLSDIVPNPGIATEFETPTGVAAVKGTSFRIGVDAGGRETLTTTEGEVNFHQSGTGVAFRVAAGNSVEVDRGAGAGMTVDFPAGNRGGVGVEMVNGVRLDAAPGCGVRTEPRGLAASLEVDRGTLLRDDGSSLAAGQSLGFANSDFTLPAGVPVKLVTITGSVELMSTETGLRAEVPAGFEIGIEGGGGTPLEVNVPATNPGPLPMTVGQRTLDLTPETAISVENGREALSVEVETGEVTVTEADGSSQTAEAGGSFNLGGSTGGDDGDDGDDGEDDGGNDGGDDDDGDDFVTLNCGECGIQVGDQCQDDDSLCEQECYVDRRCRAGHCTGGRRQTSQENPNCT